ncbi:MAG: PAS domain-containing protein, partial [Myxococcota bacterium]
MTARKTTREREEDNRRTLAVDALVTNLMVADADLNVTYVNPSLEEMLRANAEEIQQHVPAFHPDTVVGSNIDIFHKQPSYQRNLLSQLRGRHDAKLQIGELHFHLQISPLRQGEQLLGFSVEWSDRTLEVEAEKTARENARIKEALDAAQTMVMIADAEFNIVYLNERLDEMLHDAQPDIRKDLPAFDAARLRGTNIDTFHKNPAHQRGLLPKLTEPHRTDLNVGGRTFSLTVIPIRIEGGEILGYSVEWEDKT